MLKFDYCSLDELRPGKDASIDVRLDGGDEDLERLMASIATNGLLQPLIVTEPDDDGIRIIIGGNRRFAAMTRLRKEGRLPDDFEVPISVSLENDPGRLLEISQARTSRISTRWPSGSSLSTISPYSAPI